MGVCTVVRITKALGPVRPGDYVMEATTAELEAEYDSPANAVRYGGGVIWWRYLEELEGVHRIERPPFMPDGIRRRYTTKEDPR